MLKFTIQKMTSNLRFRRCHLILGSRLSIKLMLSSFLMSNLKLNKYKKWKTTISEPKLKKSGVLTWMMKSSYLSCFMREKLWRILKAT
jgi:hypothetical protein